MIQKIKFISAAFIVFTAGAISSCKKEKSTVSPPVAGNPKPLANATFTVVSDYAPALIKFNNQSERSSNYKWYVNGTLMSADKDPDIVVSKIGSSTVRLVALNNAGDSSVKEFPIAVDKHPMLEHHFAFSGNFDNSGRSTAAAGSINFQFAPGRKQQANSAVYFNGINTHVHLPGNIAGALQDSISISLWFRAEDVEKAGVVLGYQSSALNTTPEHYVPIVYHAPGRKLYASVRNGRYTDAVHAGDKLNGWIHVVVATNTLWQDIYVNGERATGSPGRINDSYMPFMFLGATYSNGGWTSLATGNNNFKGWIDDVRIYKKKLNVNEVRALYRE
jgi:Concanavalin A-like lectin/glucanases superfamily